MADIKFTSSGARGGAKGGASRSLGGDNQMEARQKALQAQKQIENKSGANNAVLTSTISKLIESNKKLISSIDKLTAAVGKGGIGGGGSGGTTSAGLGSVGASMPIGLGVAVAGAAFIIDKMAQVGNAYMAKAAEQSSSVGVGGFRRSGQGMYDVTAMGQGMKAYGMSTGKFSNDIDMRSLKSATQIGGIFGMSAEEALGKAGTFARAGGDSMASSAAIMAGGGMETQIPMLLSAVSEQMEESIKNGLDASSMAKNLSTDLTALTMASKTGSAAQAIEIARKGAESKKGAGMGQVKTAGEMAVWMAGQKGMEESFNEQGPNSFAHKQLAAGNIDANMYTQILQMQRGGKKITADEIDRITGGGGNFFTQQYVNNMSDTDASKAKLGFAQTISGYSKENKSTRYATQYTGQSLDLIGNIAETNAQLGADAAKSRINKQVGGGVIEQRVGMTEGGSAGKMIDLTNQKVALMFKYGESFATATQKTEEKLIQLADVGAAAANNALLKLAEIINGKQKELPKSDADFSKLKAERRGSIQFRMPGMG